MSEPVPIPFKKASTYVSLKEPLSPPTGSPPPIARGVPRELDAPPHPSPTGKNPVVQDVRIGRESTLTPTSTLTFGSRQPDSCVYLDGETLTDEVLVNVIAHGNILLDLTEEAWQRVKTARKVVDRVLAENRIVYGINTGFGNFSNVLIPPHQLSLLQENLITSHAAGQGDPMPLHQVRMLMALRLNVLAKGHSGIRPQSIRAYLDAFNQNCLPSIPLQGTVGASGDLAPLAHLALGMIGEGDMWDPAQKKWRNAAEVLRDHELIPIKLQAKEGLALINGTQFMCAIGTEAVVRAKRLIKTADVIAALTLEALKGSVSAYRPEIHRVRPHPGQNIVAKRMRALLHRTSEVEEGGPPCMHHHPSNVHLSHQQGCCKVQDSYTLRCIPQVHGVVVDTIEFVGGILNVEINSATDNPMVFGDTGEIISGGNFHGEYPAKALDYLAIGVQEIANISERRIERLVNPSLSGLPAFLVEEGGLNSGFMIAHCTAAALTSENKTLCHPSSADTLSTSAAKEDHVSMGGWSARKALQVVENTERVVAIELLCACQGLDFLRPLTTTDVLEDVHKLVRSVVRTWDKDRYMKPDIDSARDLVASGDLWKVVQETVEARMAGDD